jgi:uncharacterized protein (DUF488 family)
VEPPALFTIGHSNHTAEHFLGLLQRHAIRAVADVRSTPFSRRNPHFNRERLEESLAAHGIAYLILGRELGARASDPAVYRDGRVDYALLAATPLFQAGLEQLLEVALHQRVAILCAEKEPLDCHRAILVARHLAARSVSISHILADGALEPHVATEERLVALARTAPPPLLASKAERIAALARAYEIRGRAVAYSGPPRARPATQPSPSATPSGRHRPPP